MTKYTANNCVKSFLKSIFLLDHVKASFLRSGNGSTQRQQKCRQNSRHRAQHCLWERRWIRPQRRAACRCTDFRSSTCTGSRWQWTPPAAVSWHYHSLPSQQFHKHPFHTSWHCLKVPYLGTWPAKHNNNISNWNSRSLQWRWGELIIITFQSLAKRVHYPDLISAR